MTLISLRERRKELLELLERQGRVIITRPVENKYETIYHDNKMKKDRRDE